MRDIDWFDLAFAVIFVLLAVAYIFKLGILA